MLCKVVLILAFTSVTTGTAVREKAQDDKRVGKGVASDFWQKLFDNVYFNKTLEKDEEENQVDYIGGDTTIGGDGGNFFNPPATAAGARQDDDVKRIYTATMLPDNDVAQIKLTIKKLLILAPSEGDCVFDKLEITGANPGLQMPDLCGSISDQALYIDIDNSAGPYQLILTTSENQTAAAELRTLVRFWNVSIDYLSGANVVPYQCLQYHTATSGTIKSFNYGGEMLNNQRYAICFGHVVGPCGVAFTFTRLDLGNIVDIDNGGDECDDVVNGEYSGNGNRICTIPAKDINKRPKRKQRAYTSMCDDDYLLIGDSKYCGENDDLSVTVDATGPIIVSVRSGIMNDMGAEGFSANYIRVGC